MRQESIVAGQIDLCSEILVSCAAVLSIKRMPIQAFLAR